jgi:transposase
LTEATPNHSTLSRTRRLIDVETHVAVFTWVLERLAEAGLVKGKTVGVDATTLEANAAMRSIKRRDTEESYEAFVRRLAEASGVETPTRAELARFDRSRKNRKTSNEDWKSPQDPDAKIAKMKDGRTHLAHKAEHGVDLDTGAILSVTVQDASEGDTASLPETLTMAAEEVESVQPDGSEVEEVVADKGYHSDATLAALDEIGVRSYVAEPDRGRRRWQDKKTGETPPEKRAAQQVLYGNRRRIRGDRGRRLQRRRGELVERPFAHQYETGGLRRVWVRGRENVRKRVLIQAAGCNVGLLLRRLTGIGTPRSLQGRALSAILELTGRVIGLLGRLTSVWAVKWTPVELGHSIAHPQAA